MAGARRRLGRPVVNTGKRQGRPMAARRRRVRRGDGSAGGATATREEGPPATPSPHRRGKYLSLHSFLIFSSNRRPRAPTAAENISASTTFSSSPVCSGHRSAGHAERMRGGEGRDAAGAARLSSPTRLLFLLPDRLLCLQLSSLKPFLPGVCFSIVYVLSHPLSTASTCHAEQQTIDVDVCRRAMTRTMQQRQVSTKSKPKQGLKIEGPSYCS